MLHWKRWETKNIGSYHTTTLAYWSVSTVNPKFSYLDIRCTTNTSTSTTTRRITCTIDPETQQQFIFQATYISSTILKMKLFWRQSTGKQKYQSAHWSLIILMKQCNKVYYLNVRSLWGNQAINNLLVDSVKSTYFPQTFVFNISKHIESLTLRRCKFPSQTLNHLMEQINECSALRKIDLCYTSLKDVSSLTLSNKTSLTHLDLSWTQMSRELCRSVCHQLTDLTQLRYLHLSWNDLSLVDMIHLSNKPNLSYLCYYGTQMSTKLSKNVIGQLGYITHLSKLVLSGNILTGCLTNFLPDPHPGLPKLWKLDLSQTALNKEDLQHLSHLIQTHKLPLLHDLNLQYNRLCEMETDVEHLIEACVNHHQRKLELWMWRNDLSDAFREKRETTIWTNKH